MFQQKHGTKMFLLTHSKIEYKIKKIYNTYISQYWTVIIAAETLTTAPIVSWIRILTIIPRLYPTWKQFVSRINHEKSYCTNYCLKNTILQELRRTLVRLTLKIFCERQVKVQLSY